jgi:hypothetical protein
MLAVEGISRGSLRLLFATRQNSMRFLSCVLAGAPIWLTFGIFATFSAEIAPILGVRGSISVPDVLLCTSIGMTLGDIGAGALSQALQRRKLPLIILTSLACLCLVVITSGHIESKTTYLVVSFLSGLFSGYWACLITTSAEQFGTNIRATATTIIPNVVRATAIPMTTAFVTLKSTYSMTTTLYALIAVVFGLAFLGHSLLKETFHRDLDFYER